MLLSLASEGKIFSNSNESCAKLTLTVRYNVIPVSLNWVGLHIRARGRHVTYEVRVIDPHPEDRSPVLSLRQHL